MPAAVSASYCLRAAASWSVKTGRWSKIARKNFCGSVANAGSSRTICRTTPSKVFTACAARSVPGSMSDKPPCGLVGLFRDAPTSPAPRDSTFDSPAFIFAMAASSFRILRMAASASFPTPSSPPETPESPARVTSFVRYSIFTGFISISILIGKILPWFASSARRP